MNITEVMQLPQITLPCGNMNLMKVQRIHLKYEMNYNCSKNKPQITQITRIITPKAKKRRSPKQHTK